MSDEVLSFDFRSPCRLPLQVESRLLDWQLRASRLLPQKWSAQLRFTTSWEVPTPETIDCRKAELPKDFVVFQVRLANAELPTLIGLPSDLAIALVQTVLGQDIQELGPPRQLTSIEISLLEMLLQKAVDSLNEGGVGAGYPTCTLGHHDTQPLLIRIYPSEPELVVLRFKAQLPFGESSLQWIWPGTLADDLFLDLDPLATGSHEHSQHLRNLVMRVPVDVAVELGSVKLHVSDLANLSKGDVLVLDQRISEPLTCRVAGQPLLQGWPVKSGQRQAIQIQGNA